MTTALPELPPNALAEARDLLHAQLVATFERVGWSPERARRLPLFPVVVPGGWVDAATVSRQGHGIVATFPLILAVDGTDEKQVERLDALTAILWELLYAAKFRGAAVDVLTAGLDDLDLGAGVNTRAVTVTAQVPLAVRTLCPTALTSSNDTEQGDTPP